jgi:hypothetical protein
VRPFRIAAAGAALLLCYVKRARDGRSRTAYLNQGLAGLVDLVHATPPEMVVEMYFLHGDQVLHVNLAVEALPGAHESEGSVPDSVPLFADPKACVPVFRTLAGHC